MEMATKVFYDNIFIYFLWCPRKAPGGVFFTLLKQCATKDQVHAVFYKEKAMKRKKNRLQKQRAKKSEGGSEQCEDHKSPKLNAKGSVYKRLGVVEKTEVMDDKMKLDEADQMEVDHGQGHIIEPKEDEEAAEAAALFGRTESLDYGHLLSLD